jgi:diguanylate cyclase (GGDEF)-like protein
MRSSRGNLDETLRSVPDPLLFAIGLALVAGIAALEASWGRGVPIVDFLLIAVLGVGWYARSRWYGYGLAAVAAAVSVVIPLSGEMHLPVEAAVASGAARLTLYLVMLVLLGMMRRERAGHQKAAGTDQQTGAANVRAFQMTALSEIKRAQRYHHDLSLAYMDVDDFKAVNDRLGHVEGDHVLLEVSHVMRGVVRSVDTVARVGGDEFAILMPETDAASARAVIDRVRGEIALLRTVDGEPVRCSIGLVTFIRPPASLKELVDAGDDLMYRAKENGKNRLEQAERSGLRVVAAGR